MCAWVFVYVCARVYCVSTCVYMCACMFVCAHMCVFISILCVAPVPPLRPRCEYFGGSLVEVSVQSLSTDVFSAFLVLETEK